MDISDIAKRVFGQRPIISGLQRKNVGLSECLISRNPG